MGVWRKYFVIVCYFLVLHIEYSLLFKKKFFPTFLYHFDREDLKSLVHLKYCLKESMRLFPPVAGIGRVLDSPRELGGFMMPKGTAILNSIFIVHRNPDFWENPDVSPKLTQVIFI